MPASITSWLNDGELGRGFIKSTIGSVLLRLTGAAATFLVGVQLARYLGPEGYGIYGLVISMIAILAVPSQMGIPLLVTREISATHARKKWGELFGIVRWSAQTVTILSFVTALLAFAVLFFWSVLDNEISVDPFILGLLMLPILALTKLAGSGLRGFHRIVLGQAPDVVIRPLLYSALLFIWMIWVGEITPSEAIVAHALAATVALIFAWVSYRATVSRIESVSKRVVSVARWLTSGAKMAIAEALRIIDGHAAILLLGILASAEGVGHFRVAVSVATFAVLPIAVLNLVAGPLISKLYAEGDSDRLRKLIAIVAFIMTAGVIAIALPFLVAGEGLIGVVFGASYIPAVDVLILLLVAQVIHSSFGVCSTFLNMSGHEGRVTRALTISLPVNVLLIVILVPQVGIEGAAIAYICGQLVWSFLMWRDAKRLTDIDTSVLSLPILFFARRSPR